MEPFKIRCSKISDIMSPSKTKDGLSVGCISYLKEWYSEKMFSIIEQIESKYLAKGIIMEPKAIQVVSEQLFCEGIQKNENHFENDFITGTPDIVYNSPNGEFDFIGDTKCSWSHKTFLDSVCNGLTDNYYAQLQGYMHLTGIYKAKLFYVLLNTPAEANYGKEVIYEHLPIKKRFFSYDIEYNADFMQSVKDKVIKCNEWLIDYNNEIKQKLKLWD